MDEALLIHQAQRGDLESFNRLVIAYQAQVYNLAFRILGDEASAADAAQETFISAYRSLRRYRGGSFRSWLLRIVTNACYDEFRRRKRRPATSLEAFTEAEEGPEPDSLSILAEARDGPEASVEQGELAQAIQRCLDHLPDEFRVVAVMVDVQGFDYHETANAIGKPLGTVKSRLARARVRLRDCLQGYRELLPRHLRLQDEAIP
jgi:RNA polymerase sigma factor (sigma-70 family)